MRPTLAETAPSSKVGVVGPIRAPAHFRTVEEAWFWTMATLAARRDGSHRSKGKPPRPCEPEDVIRCLDRLYRQRRIDLLHARVLRIWGDRQTPPNPLYEGESSDYAIWSEALERLAFALRVKSLID